MVDVSAKEITTRTAVARGFVRMKPRVVRAVRRLIENPEEYASMSGAINPYGDGRAAERIVNALLERAEYESSTRSPTHSGKV